MFISDYPTDHQHLKKDEIQELDDNHSDKEIDENSPRNLSDVFSDNEFDQQPDL